jgi:membrane protein required for colicin V production
VNWLDIVLIVMLFVPTFIGFRKGIIKAVLYLAGLLLGIVLAGNFYQPVSKIFGFINNENAAYVLAFILILVLVMVAAFLLARLLKTVISSIMLGWVDNLGGALLGFLSGFLFLGAILAIWVRLFGSGLVTESFMGRFMLDYFPVVLGLLPGEFGEDVRNFFHP